MDNETRQKQRRRAFRIISRSEEGRTVLEYLAGFCRENEDVFLRTGNERECCYLLGRQSVALEIKKQCEEGENG